MLLILREHGCLWEKLRIRRHYNHDGILHGRHVPIELNSLTASELLLIHMKVSYMIYKKPYR